jgi:hypothetical protein
MSFLKCCITHNQTAGQSASPFTPPRKYPSNGEKTRLVGRPVMPRQWTDAAYPALFHLDEACGRHHAPSEEGGMLEVPRFCQVRRNAEAG